MKISLTCPGCNQSNEYDAFKLLGVPLTLFKSFNHSIRAQTGSVKVECVQCSCLFDVPKSDIMNITAKDRKAI